MEKSIISEGKTTNEAIEKGLEQLKVSKNMVDIKVLENSEKRSFFSILEPRIVKVELTVKEKKEDSQKIQSEKKELSDEAFEKAKKNVSEFLDVFLKHRSTEYLKYEVSHDKYYIYINIIGEKTNSLIGYRGETLNAMQTLLTSVANKEIQERIRLILDISGYREKRKKVLEELAEKVSKTVIKTRKKVVLEPMTAYERKIIHSKLQTNTKVITESIGEEPNRKVVVLLKK